MNCSDISIDMYVLQVGELVNFNISYTNYNEQKDAYRSKLVTLKLHMITEKYLSYSSAITIQKIIARIQNCFRGGGRE